MELSVKADEARSEALAQFSGLAVRCPDVSPSDIYLSIASLYQGQAEFLSEREKSLTRDILQRLTAKVEVATRARLASQLSEDSNSSRDLVLLLANDCTEVAKPVILHSPQFDDDTLLSQLDHFDDEHQAACAARPGIGEAVCAHLVESDSEDVLVALARNTEAHVSAETLVRLLEKARDRDTLQLALAMRHDLTEEQSAQLYAWVGGSMRQELRRRFPAFANQAEAERGAGIEISAPLSKPLAIGVDPEIEARIEKAERDSATALSTVVDSYKVLEERHTDTANDIARHGAEWEARHNELTADMRAYVRELSARLSYLERSVAEIPRHGEVSSPFADDRLLTHQQDEAVAEELVSDGGASEGESAGGATGSGAEDCEATASEEEGGVASSEPSLPLSAADDVADTSDEANAAAEPLAALRKLKAPSDWQAMFAGRRTLVFGGGLVLLFAVGFGANTLLKDQASAPAMHVASVVRSTGKPLGPEQAKEFILEVLNLLKGQGPAKELPGAIEKLQAAALAHQPLAQYVLGTLYQYGNRLPKNAPTAVHWYQLAAKGGNVDAMYRLGVASAEGWNGAPDYARAAKWFAEAASYGTTDAEFNLGILNERGLGVPQDRARAFMWYAIAAAQGDTGAKEQLDRLAGEISATDVAAAQKAANAFVPKIANPVVNLDTTEFAKPVHH